VKGQVTTAIALFDILGIKPTKELKKIKSAYRKMSKKYHPDITKDDGQKFKELNNAYEFIVKNIDTLDFSKKPSTRRAPNPHPSPKPYVPPIPNYVWTVSTRLIELSQIPGDTLVCTVSIPKYLLDGHLTLKVNCTIPFMITFPFGTFRDRLIFKIGDQEIKMSITLTNDLW
jgi:hypothetical protein